MRVHGHLSAAIVASAICSASFVRTVEAADTKPATRSEAAKVIDLSTIPLFQATQTNVRNLAELSYQTSAKIAEVHAFHDRQLAEKGFRADPNSTVTDQYASAIYRGHGFRIAASIFPSGSSGAMVSIANQGNVDFEDLPPPPESTRLFGGPSNLMFVSAKPVPAMTEELGTILEKSGWTPYGSAGPMRTYKNGAVLLNVMIQAAPAQGGKTVVDYQTRLVSADIPAPPKSTRIAYAEATKSLDFDTDSSLADIVGFYRKKLAENGWKPTTDGPVDERFDSFWIFRNGDKELLNFKLRKIGGSRVLIKFQTAQEVEEESRKAREFAAKKAMTKSGGKPALTIARPQNVKSWTVRPNRIVAVAETGHARKVAEQIRDGLTKSGWKIVTEALEDIAGSVVLAKDDGSLSVTYDDTGITPAELSISVTGHEFAEESTKK